MALARYLRLKAFFPIIIAQIVFVIIFKCIHRHDAHGIVRYGIAHLFHEKLAPINVCPPLAFLGAANGASSSWVFRQKNATEKRANFGAPSSRILRFVPQDLERKSHSFYAYPKTSLQLEEIGTPSF